MPAGTRNAKPATGALRPGREGSAAASANGTSKKTSKRVGATAETPAARRRVAPAATADKKAPPAPAPATAGGAEVARIDGRHLRSARSRDLVVDAILDLLREGNMRPSAYEVASRAGVSERTVFRHFEDLDQLFVAAAAHQARRISALLDPPPTKGGRTKRVHELVRRRAVLYEEISPVRRAALRHAPFHAALRAGLDRLHQVLRQQLEATFDVELAGMRSRERRDLVEALVVTASWAAWESLRSDQRLAPARAAATVELTLSSLLATACDR